MASPCSERVGRIIFLMALAGGLFCSIVVTQSCAFFQYKSISDGGSSSPVYEGLTPPFDEASQAFVGLFQFSIDENSKTDKLFGTNSCQAYDDWSSVGQSTSFAVAQWMAMVAPAVAGLIGLLGLLDLCCCSVSGWKLLSFAGLFIAGCLQGCTFLIFGDRQFCLDGASNHECTLESGAFYAIAATACYWATSLATCVLAPTTTSRPLCCGRSDNDDDDKLDSQDTDVDEEIGKGHNEDDDDDDDLSLNINEQPPQQPNEVIEDDDQQKERQPDLMEMCCGDPTNVSSFSQPTTTQQQSHRRSINI